MKKCLITCTIVFASLTTLYAQNVNEILEKHEQAMGGRANWDKIKSIKMIDVSGIGLRATSTVEPAKAMRFDSDFGGIINHQAAYSLNNGWVRFLTWGKNPDSIGIDAMHVFWPQFDLETSLLLNCKTNGASVVSGGLANVDDAQCYKLKRTEKNGHQSTFYLDTTSYYVIRMESTVSVNDEERDATVRYANYTKTTDGIMFPMSITTNNGEMAFEKIVVNVPVSDTMFKASPPDTK